MMSFYPSSYKFSVIFLCLCWHAVCFGQADTIELDRIKSAIVDAALEQGVSVVSNAYIDKDGKLVESSFYRAGAQLRGVRIPQFFAEEPYQAQVQFADTAFNTNLGCEELAMHRYRKGVRLDLSFDSLNGRSAIEFADLRALLRSTLQGITEDLIENNSSLYLLPISMPRTPARSVYEAALRPRTSDARNTNFVLKFEVEGLETAKYSPRRMLNSVQSQTFRAGRWIGGEFGITKKSFMNSSNSQSPPVPVNFTLLISMQGIDNSGEPSGEVYFEDKIKVRFDQSQNTLKVTRSVQNRLAGVTDSAVQTTKTLFDRSRTVMGNTSVLIRNSLPFTSDRSNLETDTRRAGGLAKTVLRDNKLTIAPASFESSLSDALQSVVSSSLTVINCSVEELKLYTAAGMGSGSFKLNQGARAGIAIGDKFIVSSESFSSARQPISSSQLDNLAIGEVVRTSEYSSDFIIMEGPAQAATWLSATPF
jgi:hypothetical protein